MSIVSKIDVSEIPVSIIRVDMVDDHTSLIYLPIYQLIHYPVRAMCSFQVLKVVDLNLVDNVIHITPQEKNPMGLNLAT
jgi:hypothetical protein